MGLPTITHGEAYTSKIKCSGVNAKIESFNATLNRGYTPNTANLTCVTKNTESCPFTLGTEYVFTTDYESATPGSDTTIFTGYAYKFNYENIAQTTHKRWMVSLIDALGDLEAYDVDIKPIEGVTPVLQSYYKTTLPFAYAALPTEGFTYSGNALQGLKAYDMWRGYCPYGGDGDEEGGSSFDLNAAGIRKASGGESLPGSYAIKVTAPYHSDTAEELSLAYSTASQQWWIAMAVKNEDTGKVFVLFMTYVKHADISVEEGSIQSVYFDENVEPVHIYTQSQYETYIEGNLLSSLGLSWSEGGYPFFVIPEDDDIYLILAIPKVYSLPEEAIEDEDEDAINIQPDTAAAATFLTKFKAELPDFITIHLISSSAEYTLTYLVGDEEEADIVELSQIQDEASLIAYANHEYNERVYNTTTAYEYEYGMVQILPIAVHYPQATTNHTFQGADRILTQTIVDYSVDDGINVRLTFKEKSSLSGSKRVFPSGLTMQRVADSYNSTPSIIMNIQYVHYDADGNISICWNDDTISTYTSKEIVIGENGILVWKAPLTRKEKFNYA
jgi:hypothetical protein